MDISKLKRDAAMVHAALHETPDGKLVAKKSLKIIIPQRYSEGKLAIISDTIKIPAIFAMVVDDKFYATSIACAMMQITPSVTTVIKHEDDSFLVFEFEPGSIVTPNVNLVKSDAYVYYIYDEIVAKGKVPWYIDYVDYGHLFLTSEYHGNIRLGDSNAPLEIIASSTSRSPKDRTEYFRHYIQKPEQMYTERPNFVALRSILDGPTDTVSKLMGSYWDLGMTSALVNPGTESHGVEKLLKA